MWQTDNWLWRCLCYKNNKRWLRHYQFYHFPFPQLIHKWRTPTVSRQGYFVFCPIQLLPLPLECRIVTPGMECWKKKYGDAPKKLALLNNILNSFLNQYFIKCSLSHLHCTTREISQSQFLGCWPRDILSFIHLCDAWNYTQEIWAKIVILKSACQEVWERVPMPSRPTSSLSKAPFEKEFPKGYNQNRFGVGVV